MDASHYLIAGLGNPGPDYAFTRHNSGAWLVEQLSRSYQGKWQLEKKFQSLVSEVFIEGRRCYLVLPQTFMNHSGRAVKAISQFYKISNENILIVHDEIDLSVGVARLKLGGGHGGHNGLRDIIGQLGTNDFYRIRIGVGHPGERHLVHDYVLNPPSKSDLKLIETAISESTFVIPTFLAGKAAQAMQALNTIK